jgi:hypothetical protein
VKFEISFGKPKLGAKFGHHLLGRLKLSPLDFVKAPTNCRVDRI